MIITAYVITFQGLTPQLRKVHGSVNELTQELTVNNGRTVARYAKGEYSDTPKGIIKKWRTEIKRDIYTRTRILIHLDKIEEEMQQ